MVRVRSLVSLVVWTNTLVIVRVTQNFIERERTEQLKERVVLNGCFQIIWQELARVSIRISPTLRVGH